MTQQQEQVYGPYVGTISRTEEQTPQGETPLLENRTPVARRVNPMVQRIWECPKDHAVPAGGGMGLHLHDLGRHQREPKIHHKRCPDLDRVCACRHACACSEYGSAHAGRPDLAASGPACTATRDRRHHARGGVLRVGSHGRPSEQVDYTTVRFQGSRGHLPGQPHPR